MEEKITIYTLARTLGLTPTAVSRAFNPNSRLAPEKRRLILETAEKYGYKPNQMASRLSMEQIKIGVLIYASFMPYCEKLVEGIKLAQKRLSDYKISCDLRLLERATHTDGECRAVMREFAENKYDGVILSGIYDSFNGDLNMLAEAGCKLVSIHSRLNYDGCLFSSTHDFSIAGKLSADFINAARRRSCLLVTGRADIYTHKTIGESFTAAAKDYGIAIYDTVDIEGVSDRRNWAGEYFSKHIGEFDSIYVTTGNSLDICRALRQTFTKGSLTAVISDIYPEMIEFINDGTVSASIFRNQAMQAQRAYELLAEYLMSLIPRPEPVEIVPILITRGNIAAYS